MKSITQQLIDNIVANKAGVGTSSNGSSSQGVSSVAWADVQNKPLSFPSTSHDNSSHSESYATVVEVNTASKKNINIAVAMAIALG